MPEVNVAIPSISEAAENAARFLQEAMAQAVQAISPKDVLPTDLELARSNVKMLSFVQGVGVHAAFRYVRDFIARQAVPATAAGSFLDDWLKTFGMRRKDPAAAVGVVTGTGENGRVLALGTALQDALGRVYTVTADATVVAGSVSVQLKAKDVGAAGNLPAGSQLQLVTSVPGVDPTFTTAAGLSAGADVETDEEASYRLIQRLSNTPMAGSPADYARWALTVAGITRAWGLRNPAGATSAGVIIMADNNAPYGLPTPAQQSQVYSYISDPRRGPPDELFVIIPTAQVVNVQLRITPNTAANQAAARVALKDLFFRQAVPGGELPHSHLTEVISGVAGEVDHQFVAPALTQGGKFTSTSFAHLLVLGTVTFLP